MAKAKLAKTVTRREPPKASPAPFAPKLIGPALFMVLGGAIVYFVLPRQAVVVAPPPAVEALAPPPAAIQATKPRACPVCRKPLCGPCRNPKAPVTKKTVATKAPAVSKAAGAPAKPAARASWHWPWKK